MRFWNFILENKVQYSLRIFFLHIQGIPGKEVHNNAQQSPDSTKSGVHNINILF